MILYEVSHMEKKPILSLLPDSAPISCVNLAGTHDSATAFAALKKWAKCQSLTFEEQLAIGVRLFDIRLRRSHGKFYLIHSVADCYTDEKMNKRLTFDEVLRVCKNFLRENPRETIVMSIKKDSGLKGPFDEMFFNAFYNNYIENNRALWFLENRVPALSECRGKIVLMRRCRSKKTGGLDFSVWKNQKTAGDTECFEVVLNDKYTASVQDSYSVEPHKKWKISRECFEKDRPAENHPSVHFLSTSGGNMVPEESAKIVNRYFSEYEMDKNFPTGWVLLDFATEELCSKITEPNKTIYNITGDDSN